MELRLTNVHRYAEVRREAYLQAVPITEQLEALMEADAGDRTKLDAVQARIAAIKAQYPKPDALDHDLNGKKGGSLPKTPKKPR